MLPSFDRSCVGRFRACGSMSVSGFCVSSMRSHATSGIVPTYRCILFGVSTRQSIALLSFRCFIWNILLTACVFVASHPIPQMVSVGYSMMPPCLITSSACCMSCWMFIFRIRR